MKTNVFMLFISLVISGLIFYGFHTWGDNLLYSLGTSIVCLVLLCATTAFSSTEAKRSSLMVRTTSGIFFFLMLATDILLAVCHASNTVYIIVNGLALCLWAIIAYSIARAGQ
ncbi:MAG: hypothetical protein LBU80_05600 [Rikenellaceae bacterium]|jgi:hypothetical protein|nr:hypothetical protein [Rikenellaceae bacterium]